MFGTVCNDDTRIEYHNLCELEPHEQKAMEKGSEECKEKVCIEADQMHAG